MWIKIVGVEPVRISKFSQREMRANRIDLPSDGSYDDSEKERCQNDLPVQSQASVPPRSQRNLFPRTRIRVLSGLDELSTSSEGIINV